MMYELLLAYSNKRNGCPDHILFYRDDVSGSQYGIVRTEEPPQIYEAIETVREITGWQNYDPCIALLVVGKRQHARFYPKGKANDD